MVPPPLPNPMANRRNGASMMPCNTVNTNDAVPSAFSAATHPDSLPCSSSTIGNTNVLSALPPYLGDIQNQLLRFGGDAQDLHHNLPEQNIASQAMDLSNSSLAFLSNAGSRGVNASSSQIGLTGEQSDFSSHIFRPQGDQLLLQLLMEKHSNSTDI